MSAIKIPSEKLQGLLHRARSSFENTAVTIMAAYKQAIAEGYDKHAARKLIIENVGLSDRMVRNYLPAEAKDMQFNRAKPKTAEVISADSKHSAPATAESTDDIRLTVAKEWHEKISKCITTGLEFNLVIRNGLIVAVEAAIPYNGDAGNDPVPLSKYTCET